MIVYVNEDGTMPTPAQRGLKDWYHNEKGQVDYAVFFDPNTDKPIWWSEEYSQTLKEVEIPKTRRTWLDDEPLKMNGLDNLTAERERRSARCMSFREQDKWNQEYN